MKTARLDQHLVADHASPRKWRECADVLTAGCRSADPAAAATQLLHDHDGCQVAAVPTGPRSCLAALRDGTLLSAVIPRGRGGLERLPPAVVGSFLHTWLISVQRPVEDLTGAHAHLSLTWTAPAPAPRTAAPWTAAHPMPSHLSTARVTVAVTRSWARRRAQAE